MAESFTSYSVDNDKRFRNALQRVADQIGDLRVPFGQISRDFYRSEQAIFKLKGPGQYPPLSTRAFRAWWEKDKELNREYPEGYREYKRAKYGFDYPLLVRSGRLAASLTGPRNRDSINIIGKTTLVIGSATPYGIYHQSDAPRSKIPLRKFLFIGPEAKRFANSDQMGRLDRWVGYLFDYMGQVAIKNGLASRLPSGVGNAGAQLSLRLS